MKHYLLFLLIILSYNTSAQYSRFVVKFKDKTGSSFSIDNPAAFLSVKAIERRTRQHIPVGTSDLPVLSRYIDSVTLSGKVRLLDQSKWLNQVCIETTDSAALAKIKRFPFVTGILPLQRMARPGRIERNKFIEKTEKTASPLSPTEPGQDHFSYGYSYNQIHIHHGEYLHNKGFLGKGMRIAIIDAGFYHYLSLPAFDSVNLHHQVLETYDFVTNDTNVNEDYEHGMMCFSAIAGNLPGELVGSCPGADFLLYRSEDISSESPVEEQYWIAAAERADSIGADIITTSLGYNVFDDSLFNYSYTDMNGHTSMIAKAATLAAAKGMIVLAAAGNEGDKGWHFITTPADADSIITVAAVDATGTIAPFSSFGPSSDGRIKPTLASVGSGTAISSSTGLIQSGYGTSFATPNLAGLITCLWEAYPEFTNWEIIQAVEKSSNLYLTPDDRMGYGIPDFKKAFTDLEKQREIKKINLLLGKQSIKVYPNPIKESFTVLLKTGQTGKGLFQLYDVTGKKCLTRQVSLEKDNPQTILFEKMQTFPKGLYFLQFTEGKTNLTLPLLLQ